MKKITMFLSAAIAVGALSASCSKDSTATPSTAPSVEAGDSAFVVVTKVGDAYYYMTAEELASGSISVVGNGVEGNSITEYSIIDNKALYTVADGGGSNPAPVTKYVLDAATDRIVQSNYYSTVKYESWGQWNGQFTHMAPILDSTGDAQAATGDSFSSYDVALGTQESGSALAGTYYPYYNTYSFSDVPRAQYHLADNFLGTGETVAFAGFAEAGGKLYVGVVPMYATPWAVANFRDKLEETLAEVVGSEANLDDYIARGYGRDEKQLEAIGGSLTSWVNSFTPASGIPFPLTVDKCFIAVYSDSKVGDFSNPDTIIESDLMGAALCRRVRNPRSSMTVGGDGNVYVFSPGGLRKYSEEFPQYFTYDSDNSAYSDQIENLKLVKGEHGASVMRIKAGESGFDMTFGNSGVIDLEEKFASILGDHAVTRVFSLDNNKFLLRVMDDAYTLSDGCYNTMHKMLYDTRFAVLDLTDDQNPSMSWVTGIPTDLVNSSSASAGITDPYCEDGVAYIPMGYAAGGAQIYVVDTNNTSSYAATAGLSVDTDYIIGVGKMIAQ